MTPSQMRRTVRRVFSELEFKGVEEKTGGFLSFIAHDAAFLDSCHCKDISFMGGG